MAVTPLPARGGVCFDLRDAGRMLRVSSHAEQGVVTLSIWREDRCVATCQLQPTEVANLISLLAKTLADAPDPADTTVRTA